MSDKTEIKVIPIAQIRENPVALRQVDKDSIGYTGLVDSIKTKGFLGSITVRPAVDPETKVHFFEVLDGLHRFTAAKDAGVVELPCVIKSINKVEALEWQLMANQHKIETKPVEYTQQLQRLMQENPLMTVAELATKLAVSPTFINQRMSLTKLSEPIGKMVDAGKIKLSNAYMLAKLPEEVQAEFVDSAIQSVPAEFAGIVNARVKEIRDARRQGREANPQEWAPVATLRRPKELVAVLSDPTEVMQVVKQSGAKKPEEIVAATLAWVVQLDTASVERKRAEYMARKEKAKAEAEKRKQEKADKKAAEAAAEAARIREATAK